MKRNSINFIATITIAMILSQLLPWWAIMIASFLTGLFYSLKRSAVFLVPFFAIAVFWWVYSFWLSNTNDFILAKKVAVLLPLNGNPYLLIFITGLISGIAGGIAAVFGKQCNTLIGLTSKNK